MVDYGKYGYAVPGEAYIFPDNFNKVAGPLEHEMQRKEAEEAYQRQVRAQQQKENAAFLRNAFEFSPDVLMAQYQPSISKRVQDEYIPLATRVYRGDQQPTQADEQKLYTLQNDIKRQANMINKLNGTLQANYNRFKDDKTGEINETFFNKKMKDLVWNPDDTVKPIDQIDFNAIEKFWDDPRLLNLGARTGNFYKTLENIVTESTSDVPSAYGNAARQTVKITAMDMYETRVNPKTGETEFVLEEGKLVPKISDKFLFQLQKEDPVLYDGYATEAKSESDLTNNNVTIKDIAQRYANLHTGYKKEVQTQNISKPGGGFNMNFGGLQQARVPIVEERVDRVVKNAIEAINGGPQLLENIKAGTIDGRQIINAKYDDFDTENVPGQGPIMVNPKKIIVTYRVKAVTGQEIEKSQVIKIDFKNDPYGALENINRIMNTPEKGERGQVSVDEFRTGLKQRSDYNEIISGKKFDVPTTAKPQKPDTWRWISPQ
jgi:hypothetical protein